MHRIDSSGAVAGLYTAGNPATGQRATLIDADHLNAIQEEICAVIEGAEIDLEKGTNNQLLAAIAAMIAGASPGAGYVLETDATKFGNNANGYWEKRPNGVIEQWGRVTGSFGEGSNTKAFPIAFTDAASVVVHVWSINADGGTGTSRDIWTQFRSNTVNDFTFLFQASDNGASAGGYKWRAIGI